MRYYQTVPFPVGPVTVMEEGGEIVFIGFSADHWQMPQKKERPPSRKLFASYRTISMES